ncbi:hypothetical protein NC652_010819 [Populus alba x Populus x berolinensis]|uniref:Uncharacterized protein n=1 Tax=Populus tomentosa TaxID=118781 RepID=A0A8X8D820_POPTO|nr:hypothetical protein POTOM_015347 [Populus tomentosa]KAJ6935894.1 hypothetical protein NC652_010819 [Populus alba x Populus x berolinensis]
MSTEIEDVAKSTSDDDTIQEFHKGTRYAYKKGFLLSLAEIDECKRLPSGFDSSILCELNAAATSRSTYLLYESDRRDGIQSPDSWMNPANDHSQQYPAYGHPQQNPANGLLGNMYLLRAPVCVAESSAQNVRSCNLLNKSIAPYRPPRLYMMNLLSGRENKDEKDGETFGFTECPRLETAEGERRGRESPEWTGKEHKNGDQENRKNISDEHKENLDPDVATHLDDFRTEKRLFNKCTQSEECALSSTPSDAIPCSSTPRTIISKLLPHELTSKSPEQSLETKSNKKAKQHEVTSLQLVSDEIWLPDEDSLITSDDFKLPVDSVLLPESNVTETDLFASSSRMPGNVSQMVAAVNVPLDERSQSSLEVPLTCSGSDNINGLDTSHGNLRARQEFSHHSQTNQSRALFCPSDSQRARRTKFKPHLKNLSYNHPPISYIPLYVLPLDPYDASTSFDIPTMQPFLQQILVPAEFPHQVNGLPRGPSYPPPLKGMASYSPLNYCHQTYRGSTTTSPGSHVVANSGQAAINNRLPEMEHLTNQMHPGWPWTASVRQFS